MKRIRRTFAIAAVLIALPMIANPQEPAGFAALQSSQTGRTTHWQNWVFIGAALAAAAIGITYIALSQGSQAH